MENLMNETGKLYSYEFLPKEDILIFQLHVSEVDKDIAKAIYGGAGSDKKLQEPEYFIMNAASVRQISDPAIGILMKAMSIMKKVKGYLAIVMTEEFLQDIMVAHPEMFNYIAVFHSVEDAKAFIERSRN